jgi:hypothetical protein
VSFEAEVQQGIALLDEQAPDWRGKIDLDRLDMRQTGWKLAEGGCGCILAHVFGSYWIGIEELGFRGTEDVPYGFDTTAETGWDYVGLTDAWKQALTPDGAP